MGLHLVWKLKQRPKKWTAKSKRDLQSAFAAFNPCTNKDWEQVVRSISGVRWTVEEAKEQAKKMKLQPLVQPEKPKTPETSAVDKIRKLIPGGHLPRKGTVRREALEEEVMQQLYVRRKDDDEETSPEDPEDAFIREALQNHASIADLHLSQTINRAPKTSRRAYFPKTINASRDQASQDAINAVGDDFSIPDRGKGLKYRFKYRAQQFKRRYTSTLPDNDAACDDA